METEQTLRRRIKTVGDLHAIVRTLKALAAVNARQSETALQAMQAYAKTVEQGLQVALRGQSVQTSDRPKPCRLPAIAVFGSDVGLCGRFNEELAELAAAEIKRCRLSVSAGTLLAIGSRVGGRLSELGYTPAQILSAPGSSVALTTTVQQVLVQIEAWQEQGCDRMVLIYSRACTPASLQLLPIDFSQFGRLRGQAWPSRSLPTYSMDNRQLMAALIRQHLFVCLFRACAESLASEHLMRLRTTQAAEKNIEEKLDELGAEFRCRRQDAIDAELLDIGAGFEAVSGQ